MRSPGPDRLPKKARLELQPFAQASLGPILPKSAGSVSGAAYWEVTTVLSITARGDSVYFPLITDHKKVHESS